MQIGDIFYYHWTETGWALSNSFDRDTTKRYPLLGTVDMAAKYVNTNWAKEKHGYVHANTSTAQRAEFAEMLGCDVDDLTVLIPDRDGKMTATREYRVDDGNAEVSYEAASPLEAAKMYVADGEWHVDEMGHGDINVKVWWHGDDDEDDLPDACRYDYCDVEGHLNVEWHEVWTGEVHSMTIPDCNGQKADEDKDDPYNDAHHIWMSDHALFRPALYWLAGGLRENPGVIGEGGGVARTDYCARCGLRKSVSTWDSSRNRPHLNITYDDSPVEERDGEDGFDFNRRLYYVSSLEDLVENGYVRLQKFDSATHWAYSHDYLPVA